jgi:hypothetical protein
VRIIDAKLSRFPHSYWKLEICLQPIRLVLSRPIGPPTQVGHTKTSVVVKNLRDLASALMDARGKTWIWMAAAFCASLGLALAFVAVSKHKDFTVALAISARVAFLFFWPAYVGGALTSLFGNIFRPLKEHARDFGLAFAAALLVHLGFVIRLCVVGPAPSAETFVIFGTAAVFAYLLALLSISRVRQALPRTIWPPIRFVAMNYIAFAFLLDFAKFPSSDLRQSVAYLPFAALAIIGPALRLAAWVQNSLIQGQKNWAAFRAASHGPVLKKIERKIRLLAAWAAHDESPHALVGWAKATHALCRSPAGIGAIAAAQ